MKVYAVLFAVDYEGETLKGVFATKEEAVSFAKSQENFGKHDSEQYGVVECELGQPVDTFENFEFVE